MIGPIRHIASVPTLAQRYSVIVWTSVAS